MILLMCVAGGLGAVARHLIDTWLRRILPERRWSLPILIINLLGSVLLGLAAGASAAVVLVLGTGFAGAFTTFSTVFVDVLKNLLAGHWRTGVLYGVGTLSACGAAAAGGVLLSPC